MNKHKALRAIANKRKRSRWPGYKCIGDYHRGKYECDFVSPHTKSAKNVKSPIMVLLQDWISDDGIKGPFYEVIAEKGYSPSLHTNRRLITLLKSIFNVNLNDIFTTNLFPFVKMGRASAPIPQRDLERAAVEFARPQIEIVRPKLVICLGLNTFNALRVACGQEPVHPMAYAIQKPFFWGNSNIWCQAHTGSRGQNNRGRKQVLRDWRWMKKNVPIKS